MRNHRRKSAEHLAGFHKSAAAAAADLSAFPVDKLDGFAGAAAAAADKSVQKGLAAAAGTGSTAFEEEEEGLFVDKPSAAADKAAAVVVPVVLLVEDRRDLESLAPVLASNHSTPIQCFEAFGRRATSWPSLVPYF